MDPEKFHALTAHLLKYNAKMERHVLITDLTEKPCVYCPKEIANQRITCEAHRLGTPNQHFKHKCQNCKMIVYDGSSKEPYTVKKPTHTLYYMPVKRDANGLTKNGLRLGRPKKGTPKVEKPKRARGRPRKNISK